MAGQDQHAIPKSMMISGSSVTVVGIILLITNDWFFLSMVAFGVAIVLLGVFLSRGSTAGLRTSPPPARKDR